MGKKFANKKQGQKKGHFFEEILNFLSKNPNKTFNYKQIAADLNITDQSQKLMINTILEELKATDTVEETERGKFKVKNTERFITGKVDMTASGTAYIVSEEVEEDVMIQQKKKHPMRCTAIL